MTINGALAFIRNNQTFSTLSIITLNCVPEFVGEYIIKHFKGRSVSDMNDLFDQILKINKKGNLEVDKIKTGITPDLFLNISYFPEWLYLINLNNNKFEIYNGKTHEKKEGKPYYSLVLVKTFNFDDIPEDWLEQVTQNQYL